MSFTSKFAAVAAAVAACLPAVALSGQATRSASEGSTPTQEIRFERTTGTEFDSQARFVLNPGESAIAEAIVVLGPPRLRESLDDEAWFVWEHERISGSRAVGDPGSVLELETERTGARLRVLVDDLQGSPVVARWVYEEWAPGSRTVESSEYAIPRYLAALELAEEALILAEEARASEDPELRARRQALIESSLERLARAGITDEGTRRRLLDQMLDSEGLSALSDEEARQLLASN